MALQEAVKHLEQALYFGNGYRVIRWLKSHTEGDHEIQLYTVMLHKAFKEGYIIYKNGEEIIRSIGIYDDIVSILNKRIHDEFLFELGIINPTNDAFIWRKCAPVKKG